MSVNEDCIQKTLVEKQKPFAGIGVSPAYFVSKYGQAFTLGQVEHSLPELAELGFSGYQLELVSSHSISDWTDEALESLFVKSAGCRMEVSQFVAHFLMDTFSTEKKAASSEGYASFVEVLGKLKERLHSRLVTVPVGAAAEEPGKGLKAASIARIKTLWKTANALGFRFALEIIPGFCLGGYLETYSALHESGLAKFGFTLDTKHVVNNGDSLLSTIRSIGENWYATHICDTPGTAGSSLIPGDGVIDWAQTLAALRSTGYKAQLDIEIGCPANKCREFYTRGIDFLAKKAGLR